MNQPLALTGCLLGTAVGDALGLPYEGLSASRARRMLGEPTRYRFLFGRGMISDDTEHACMTLQALRSSGGDLAAFRRSLAWRLRWWLASFPAGMGLATLKSIVRLWCGVAAQKSGVFSAGNGAAMRAGVLGVALDDLAALREFVLASTVMTHRDPRAFHGALAIAVAAHQASRIQQVSATDYLAAFIPLVGPEGAEMVKLLSASAESAARGESVEEFAKSLGLHRGVSGFVNHTVPIVIQAWLQYPRDFECAIQSVIRCGGDADTTAALVGGIVGAAVGREGISERWIRGLWEWPRTALWMERLAREEKPVEVFWVGQVCRNLVFLVVVLVHGFRRHLPPW